MPNLVRLVLILQVAGAEKDSIGFKFWPELALRPGARLVPPNILVPGFARRGTCLHTLLRKAA